jgi:radical SAM protein with 4Fe4S-binding SPASM domain
MVRTASDQRIFTSTSTNAHFLDDDTCQAVMESGLDRMLISIDGTDQETYEQYRKGGRLDKVLAGTEAMVRARRDSQLRGPELVFQFLVVKPNEHQIEDIKALGKKMGIDRVALKTAQIYDFEHGNELIPSQHKYSRYKRVADGRYSIKNPLDDQCWKMWHSCVITWDGQVVPCCFDKDAHHRMGDLKNQSLSEIWYSEAYESFRKNILSSRSTIEMCRNCSEGTRVWAKE